MVNIRDVAKALNLSVSTVSRAINNKSDINDNTRDMIINKIKEMGYSPNAMARNLISRKSNTIGLIIPDISDPTFSENAKGIEDTAKRYNYSVIYVNTDRNKQREINSLEILSEKRVDGVVITPDYVEDNGLDKYMEKGYPIVLLRRNALGSRYNYVDINNIQGGYTATEHLIKKGRRRIAYIGLPHTSRTGLARFEGYKKALADYGIGYDDRLVFEGDYSESSGISAMDYYLSLTDVPDAVFAANDNMAFGVLIRAREKGVSVPQDLAVIGFNNSKLSALPTIEMTTMDQPLYNMGVEAANILFDIIRNEQQGVTQLFLSPTLVERKTT